MGHESIHTHWQEKVAAYFPIRFRVTPGNRGEEKANGPVAYGVETSAGLTRPTSASDTYTLASAIASMQRMQDLQSSNQNVRHTGHYMDAARYAEAGAGRLPLLHAVEGDDGGKLLAGGETGISEHRRLATRTQQFPNQPGGHLA